MTTKLSEKVNSMRLFFLALLPLLQPCLLFSTNAPLLPPITVVFDIGDVIAAGDDEYGTASSPNKWFPNLDIFNIKDTSHIEENDHFYTICPFVSEAICWLMTKQITVAFFSGALESRNLKLVDAYFHKKLGKETYESLKRKGQFAVYSRKHGVLAQEYLEYWRYIDLQGQIKDPSSIAREIVINLIGDEELLPTDEMQALINANQYDTFRNEQYDKVLRGEFVFKQSGYIFTRFLKSLSHIGLDLENSILVDDSIENITLGEEEFIYLVSDSLMRFHYCVEEEKDLENKQVVNYQESCEESLRIYGMPYVVGIVSSALDIMKETNISFRAAIAQILPSHTRSEQPLYCPFCSVQLNLDRKKYCAQVRNEAFWMKMIERGMHELQQLFPELEMIKKVPYFFPTEPFAPFLQAWAPTTLE